jgi:hypothetical protein
VSDREGFCRHYRGIGRAQDTHCAAGVAYIDVAQKSGVHEDGRPYPILTGLPCVRTDRHDADAIPCAAREWPTPAQIAEEEARITESVKEMTRRMAEQECIHCGAKVERYKEVRPCVYAEPCGHRQWQGRAPKRLSVKP